MEYSKFCRQYAQDHGGGHGDLVHLLGEVVPSLSYDGFRDLLVYLGWPVAGESDHPVASPSGVVRDVMRVRYPWFVDEIEGRYRSHCSFSSVPNGWLDPVVLPLCEDIRDALRHIDDRWLCKYALDQVKEKYGTLRWYDRVDDMDADLGDGFRDSSPHTDIDRAISVAGAISEQVCSCCGSSHDVWLRERGWISSYCLRCLDRFGYAKPDALAKEAEVRHVPYGLRDAAMRTVLSEGNYSPIRHEIEHHVHAMSWTPGSEHGRDIDLFALAVESGVAHTVGMARRLDSQLGEDRLPVITHDEMVEKIREASSR